MPVHPEFRCGGAAVPSVAHARCPALRGAPQLSLELAAGRCARGDDASWRPRASLALCLAWRPRARRQCDPDGGGRRARARCRWPPVGLFGEPPARLRAGQPAPRGAGATRRACRGTGRARKNLREARRPTRVAQQVTVALTERDALAAHAHVLRARRAAGPRRGGHASRCAGIRVRTCPVEVVRYECGEESMRAQMSPGFPGYSSGPSAFLRAEPLLDV